MKHLAILGAAAALLSACVQNPTTGATELTFKAPVSADTLRTGLAEGQLLCAAGPGTVAMFSSTGAKILAKDAAKQAVDDVCGLIGSVAVSPKGAPVGTVTVTLPSSLVIPLKG